MKVTELRDMLPVLEGWEPEELHCDLREQVGEITFADVSIVHSALLELRALADDPPNGDEDREKLARGADLVELAVLHWLTRAVEVDELRRKWRISCLEALDKREVRP